MAGRGTRMRPHTLTVPKPLTPIAGKPIVQRLLEDIAAVCREKIEEIAYIIGDFGQEVEKDLIRFAESLGAVAKIYYQEQPLGTAHAVYCAKESLSGNVIVAFADTLFRADFVLDTTQDGIIWVQQVPDPSAFGVVKLDEDGYIAAFVEKPAKFVSDLAIIGIYYFRDGDYLRQELQYLIDNDIRNNNEYQLTNALENMKAKGSKFRTGRITEWLDCGNKDATVFANKRYLEYIKDTNLIAESAKIISSVVIPPVYLGENVELYNSVVGPHVSIGSHTKVRHSIIQNSIIQQNTRLENANMLNSMIGSNVKYIGKASDLSIGDYTTVK
jgi:glucose-1-phosphate thymidylyltransferase